ncbi:MAG: efflux RND transporter periplasmic adaptor subunit [Fibrobacteres bacterium]|jgi:RND family efflux transporter MFP subunit|nr:efflux RND transporter periplasmic adaptor subunit [Fibrobacterota bacterium]
MNAFHRGVLALAGFLLLSNCGKAKESAGRPVVVGPAVIRDAVRLSGNMQPLDSVNIKSEVSGQIVKVFFREGDAVKRGQLVAQIDSSTFIVARDKAGLEVDRNRLSLKLARRELERAKQLAVTGSVSVDRLEDLSSMVEKAELDLRSAQLVLSDANLNLVRTRIRAPMDGRLIAFSTVAGMVASSATNANGGTSLGTIADPSRLKVVVEVGELDYVRLKLGMPVAISTENGKSRKAKVSFIPSSARASSDAKTIKVFPVEVVLDDDATGLLPGMTVGVDFVFLERRADLTIPYEAIRTAKAGTGAGRRGKGAAADSTKAAPTDSGKDSGAGVPGRPGRAKLVSSSPTDSGKRAMVMVRREGKIVPAPILVGVTDYRQTEVLAGLVAGDTVWVMDESADAAAKKNAMPGGPPGGGH